MTEQRKQQVINDLINIHNNFEVREFEEELTMFSLISRYNGSGKNIELIGGSWVIENCPEPLKSLPS